MDTTRRFDGRFWLIELSLIAYGALVAGTLPYTQYWYLSEHGSSVNAVVDELPLDEPTCEPCPVAYEVDGERHVELLDVDEMDAEGLSAGTVVELLVDRHDPTSIAIAEQVRRDVSAAQIVSVGCATWAVCLPIATILSHRRRRGLLARARAGA